MYKKSKKRIIMEKQQKTEDKEIKKGRSQTKKQENKRYGKAQVKTEKREKEDDLNIYFLIIYYNLKFLCGL